MILSCVILMATVKANLSQAPNHEHRRECVATSNRTPAKNDADK
jgi:hypothetical protein